jgi:hypothetical protein
VLTAAHVVGGAERIRIRLGPEQRESWVQAQVVWSGGDQRGGPALLRLAGAAEPSVDRVAVGRARAVDAVLSCSAVGFPWFKVRTAADGGSRYRDPSHVHGAIPLFGNRRSGTLELRVHGPLPAPRPQQSESPWAGMSGAAVWVGPRLVGIVVEDHLAEGSGTLTVSPAASWPDAADDRGREILHEAGLAGPFEPLGPVPREQQVAEGHLALIRSIAPAVLLDREEELAELVRFCARPDGYDWWQAPPWYGKTALAAWFAAHPPAGVAVAAFLISRRSPSRSGSVAFLEAMISQLGLIAGETPVPGADPGHPEREFHRLLPAAARRQSVQGRGRLLLLVDGLDEDEQGSGPSIASLLPRRLPEGTSVIVTGRRQPQLPADVPGDHPLRACVPRDLSASVHARGIEHEARYELARLLDGSPLQRDIVGLLAASGGGLTASDLGALTGRPAERIARELGGPVARSLADDHGYEFAHDTLRETAEDRLLPGRLPGFRRRLRDWALEYGSRGWPPNSPGYLLRGYGCAVLGSGDQGWITELAADSARHDLMADRLQARQAVREVGTAQDLAAERATVPASSLVRLALEHARLIAASEDREFPYLPALQARLGRLDHAEALIEGMTSDSTRLMALASLISRLTPDAPGDAARLARRAVELLTAVPDDTGRFEVLRTVVTQCVAAALMSADEATALALLGAVLLRSAPTEIAEQGGPRVGSPRPERAAGEAARILVQHGKPGAAARLLGRLPAASPGHTALRAALPVAYAEAGRPADAWAGLPGLEPAERDRVLHEMRRRFMDVGDRGEAWRAVRAIRDPEIRRAALIRQALRADTAAEALGLAEAACPHASPHAAADEAEAPPASLPCSGECVPVRVHALCALGRWDEADTLASTPSEARLRREAAVALCTHLTPAGRSAQARALLSRYQADGDAGLWPAAAVALITSAPASGRCGVDPQLVQDLLSRLADPASGSGTELPEALSWEVRVLAALVGRGDWQPVAAQSPRDNAGDTNSPWPPDRCGLWSMRSRRCCAMIRRGGQPQSGFSPRSSPTTGATHWHPPVPAPD